MRSARFLSAASLKDSLETAETKAQALLVRRLRNERLFLLLSLAPVARLQRLTEALAVPEEMRVPSFFSFVK